MGNTLSEGLAELSHSRHAIIATLEQIDVTLLENQEDDVTAVDNNTFQIRISQRIAVCSEDEIRMISDFISQAGGQDQYSFLGELKMELADNNKSISDIVASCSSTLGGNYSHRNLALSVQESYRIIMN